MANGVEFEEDKFSYAPPRPQAPGMSAAPASYGRPQYAVSQQSGLSGWLMNHGWAKSETEGSASIGVDALAVAALGSVVSVESQPARTRAEQGQSLFTLSCGTRRLEVKAPVGGVVSDVNREVLSSPTLVKDSPYGAGWVVWLEGVNFSRERSRLASGSGIRAWFRGEVDRFTEVLGVSQAAPTMADGGVLSSDLSAHVDDAKWDEIASKFFASTRA